MRQHIICAGDTLSALTLTFYGADLRADPVAWKKAYTALSRFNGVRDPNLIFTGQALAVPATLADLYARVETGALATAEYESADVQDIDPAATVMANATTTDAALVLYLPPGRGITSGYGPRAAIPSIGVPAHFHSGVDVAWGGCGGYPIYALADGVVTHAGDTGNGYGNHVIVTSDAGPVYMLAHLRAETVTSNGERVVQGVTLLGHIGTTGMSTGDHLHLETQRDADGDGWTWGDSCDPADLIDIQPDTARGA